MFGKETPIARAWVTATAPYSGSKEVVVGEGGVISLAFDENGSGATQASGQKLLKDFS